MWLYCLLLLLATVDLAAADVKIWQKNTNFDDPANWNGGGVICSNDRKKFAPDTVASIFIQKNESLQELVLSNNMILTFGEGAVLTFSQNPDVLPSSQRQDVDSAGNQGTSQCTAKGRVLEFTAKASSWFDPSSWNTTEAPSANNSRRFMLDLDKVPCSKDKVVFPAENSFQVDMDNQALNADTITIRNQELMNQEAFDKYWQSELSTYDFVNRSSNNVVTGKQCKPEDHCSCAERYTDDMKAEVCKYMKQSDDLSNACAKPITPTYGQCNPMCGALMTLIFNQSDSTDMSYDALADIESAIMAALDKSPTVLYSIGPFKDPVVEITLKDTEGDGSSASKSVCDIRKQLSYNTTTYIQGITDVQFTRSDGEKSCNVSPTVSPQQKTKNKFDFVILGVALGVGILFIILVVAGFALYRRRYHGTMKNELEMGDINTGNRLTSQGFDNPVYNSPLPYDDNFVISYETDNDQITGFENTGYVPGPEVKQKKPESRSPSQKSTREDKQEPPAKKSKQKGKKSKSKADVGFDNPVYDLKQSENTDSMVSVSLEEDDVVIPDHVEHDGVGFVNPIATGLSESQMAPETPTTSTPPKTNGTQNSRGIENPLYESPSGSNEAVSDGTASPPEVTVQPAIQNSKKKKSKKNKKQGKAAAEEGDDGDLGFGNPLYGNTLDFYQPESGPDDGDL